MIILAFFVGSYLGIVAMSLALRYYLPAALTNKILIAAW